MNQWLDALGLVGGSLLGWMWLPHWLLHPCPDDCPRLQVQDPARLRTRIFTPQTAFSQAVLDLFTSRLTSPESVNFIRGLCLHRDYVASREFMSRKGGYSWRGFQSGI